MSSSREQPAWRHTVVAGTLQKMGAASVVELAERLRPVLDDDACDALVDRYGDGVRACDHEMPAAYRRRHGIYFTPTELADRIAALAVEPDESGDVVDLSCGDGSLLEAVARRARGARVVGVERELEFAVAAAGRLVRSRGEVEGRDRIIWGDGLEARSTLDGASAAVGNPPYVGEKGNREIFAAVREAHPGLEVFFGPRIDLHYLFIHRGLDLLAPEGKLVYLTSEYWLTATGAAKLRADLADRSVVSRFERLGAGAFEAAPGHHSLLLVAHRRPSERSAAAGVQPAGRAWHPFAEIPKSDGVALGELCRDRQGFVSGADRVTRRRAEKLEASVEVGAPIFLWRADEVPAGSSDLFRPLLRRSDCAANRVFLDPPGNDFVLWSDGTEDALHASRVEVLLQPFRPLLEARREAKQGTMPWRRIWWPRDASEYALPKLVVPRRAKSPAFCLDLSGSYVSSDCTFLLAPEGVDGADVVRWLLTVMLLANSRPAERQIRAYGKSKGDILEFYSEPLRRWRLPADLRGGAPVPRDAALGDAVEDALETIARLDRSADREGCVRRSSFDVVVE